MQSLHWNDNMDWSQHPHISSWHNKNMTATHFGLFFSHILIIFKLHKS